MSLLSQFFGGKEIDLEILMVAGGGGGGSQGPAGGGNYAGGGGGGGAVFYGLITIKPGSTCPIVVGAGGAGGGGLPGSFGNPGLNGTNTSITTPVTTISVAGGGGGGNAFPSGIGLRGGCGGGAGGQLSGGFPDGIIGKSIYYSGGSIFNAPVEGNIPFSNKGSNVGGNVSSNKYGTFHGYPGSGASQFFSSPSYYLLPGSFQGGGAGGSGGSMSHDNWFSNNIAGISSDYGAGGQNPGYIVAYPAVSTGANLGNGGNSAPPASTPPSGTPGSSGSSGTVILKYPTQFAAAPAFPGATDLSPSTPGFRTYQFTSTGSITLP